MNLLFEYSTSLTRLTELKTKLQGRSRTAVRHRRGELKPKSAQVLETVKHVLELSDKPLSPKKVHYLCEELLAHSVSWSSVYDCLQRHSKTKDSLFIHTSYGRYLARKNLTSQSLLAWRRYHPGS